MRSIAIFVYIILSMSTTSILAEEQTLEWSTPEVERSEIPAIAQPAVDQMCKGLRVGSFQIYNSSDEWPDDFKNRFEEGDKPYPADFMRSLKERQHAFVNCGPRKMILGGDVSFIVDLKTGKVLWAERGE